MDDDAVEIRVDTVEVRGGFVCHVGRVEGVVKVGDVMRLRIDEERRKQLVDNHSATHILNFALRQVRRVRSRVLYLCFLPSCFFKFSGVLPGSCLGPLHGSVFQIRSFSVLVHANFK